MSCPHREPCDECKRSRRRSARVFAWICAVLAPPAAALAVLLAWELDPRSSAWAGFAIGCVLCWNMFRIEARA